MSKRCEEKIREEERRGEERRGEERRGEEMKARFFFNKKKKSFQMIKSPANMGGELTWYKESNVDRLIASRNSSISLVNEKCIWFGLSLL